MQRYTTKTYKETQKLGEKMAKEILSVRHYAPQDKNNSAVVLSLSGNLGGGKTTFLQGFAKGLGVKEKILSPTFVILKHFKIQNSKFTDFYHFDFYRLNKYEDFSAQGGPAWGWKNIINNPKNIIAIEWPEKIKKALPKNTTFLKFKFIDEKTRELTYKK